MNDEHKELMGLTDQESDDLETLAYAYATILVIGGREAGKIPFMGIVSYVNDLLAAKDARIKELEARQITPEMIEGVAILNASKDPYETQLLSHLLVMNVCAKVRMIKERGVS